MFLADDDIKEFQAAWQKDFNEELSADEARNAGSGLLELILLFLDAPRDLKDNDKRNNTSIR